MEELLSTKGPSAPETPGLAAPTDADLREMADRFGVERDYSCSWYQPLSGSSASVGRPWPLLGTTEQTPRVLGRALLRSRRTVPEDVASLVWEDVGDVL